MFSTIAYSRQSGGVSHLLSLIEHSVIYSTIRRFIYSLPVPVLIVVFAIAAIGIIYRGGMMKSRGRRTSTNVKTIVVTKDADGKVVSTRETTKQ